MRAALDRLSIRARITIGTVLLAGLFFGGAGFVVRHQVEGILNDDAVELLQSDAAPFETALQREPGDTLDTPGDGQLVAVIDASGVIRTSTLPADVSAAFGSLDLGSRSAQKLETPSADYLVLVETVDTANGSWTIVSARNHDASGVVLDRLTAGLVIGLGALTLLFGVMSWLLTGAALRPVSRLRRSADAIVASGSSELLPVGPARDEITELATTLNHLIADLRASAARERQMVSDASHELRTPLAVLQAQLELLRTSEHRDLESDVRAAERAAARLAHLVADLLELSRLEAQTGGTATPVAELVAEAGDAIDRARLQAAGQEVAIDFAVPPAEATDTGTVTMPALLYGRVLDNLLSNALTAVGGAGRITLSLEVAQAPDGQPGLVTVVADSGAGIAAEFLPHAFDRFSQEDSARAGGQGAGLGLAIVAAAVEAAGGSAAIRNSDDAGAIVSITIPIGRKPLPSL
ncbi:HAMP domain-containing sensor histidine kinase [Herbiconiux sp. 11R-BC]|uniref:sensor histidine kinase n=1 Tax=Herbiconiux sp. 11R-BC TaxID=3111637 RepID=UPI003C10FE5B